jgi:excisionase family DNA binding protein
MEKVTLMTETDFCDQMQMLSDIKANLPALNGCSTGAKSLYTIKDASEYLQVSKRSLQRYRDQGLLGFSQIGDKIYFKPSDLETFLANHRVTPFNLKGGSGHGKN